MQGRNTKLNFPVDVALPVFTPSSTSTYDGEDVLGNFQRNHLTANAESGIPDSAFVLLRPPFCSTILKGEGVRGEAACL